MPYKHPRPSPQPAQNTHTNADVSLLKSMERFCISQFMCHNIFIANNYGQQAKDGLLEAISVVQKKICRNLWRKLTLKYPHLLNQTLKMKSIEDMD